MKARAPWADYDRRMQDWCDRSRFAEPALFRSEADFPSPPTMLHPSEQQLLRWMARDAYTGVGAIIDLGCWMGGSTAALVTGLRENRRVPDRSKVVDTYDYFLWHSSYDRYNLGFGLEPGQSFQHEFDKAVEPWHSNIRLHVGNIEHAVWDGGPIEFLFVDIMKDEVSTRVVARTFFPHVIAGVTYLIHQDYKHYYTFWLHILMFRMRNHFAPALNVHDASSVVFQAVTPPTDTEVSAACDFSTLTATELTAAFDYSRSVVAWSTAPLVEEVERARQRAVEITGLRG
jgi:hypothetical protein